MARESYLITSHGEQRAFEGERFAINGGHEFRVYVVRGPWYPEAAIKESFELLRAMTGADRVVMVEEPKHE